MNDTQQTSSRPSAWTLSAPILTAAAALIGVSLGFYANALRTGADERIADRENLLRVVEVRRQIILALDGYDKRTLEVLLEQTLRPIDPVGFEDFRRSMMDLVADRAAGADPRAPSLEGTSSATVPAVTGTSLELVKLLGGPDRLRASNALVELHRTDPAGTVAALFSALVPESPRNNSYTINLYVVFTLARLEPFWGATSEQLRTLESLKQYRSYKDPTFKLRVDQATANARS